MALVFLIAVYTSIFVRPGHGDMSSLAPAVALYGVTATGGHLLSGEGGNFNWWYVWCE